VAADSLTFHADKEAGGIPLRDALIGIYAAYYIGAKGNEVKDHLNYNFNLRAKNTFNMGAAMDHAFGQLDSPWVVIDHLSDKRRDAGNTDRALHGAHFVALYHKDSKRVMIAMPGLESDDNIGDTFMDLQQMALGGMRGQSVALYSYTKELETKINTGAFKGADGAPLEIAGKPVIGAHSMGCTAAQMMALDGYKTVLLEPRPVHAGLIRRLSKNFEHITGRHVEAHDLVARLDDSAVNIRSKHSNVWNSLILPWIRQREVGQNYAYGIDGQPVKPADRGIGTLHRAEMSVPSLNGNPEAKAYEANTVIAPAQGKHRPLIADIISKPR
jgi:hypothetical protein